MYAFWGEMYFPHHPEYFFKNPIFPLFTSGDLSVLQQEQTLRFRLSRFNRYLDYYDAGDGDWGWLTENIDEDREQVISWEMRWKMFILCEKISFIVFGKHAIL